MKIAWFADINSNTVVDLRCEERYLREVFLSESTCKRYRKIIFVELCEIIELNNYNEWREKYIWKIYWWKLLKEILIELYYYFSYLKIYFAKSVIFVFRIKLRKKFTVT